jgi:hypothetical protein
MPSKRCETFHGVLRRRSVNALEANLLVVAGYFVTTSPDAK